MNEDKADQLTHEAELIDNVRECASLENVINFPEIEPVNKIKISGMAMFQESPDVKIKVKLVKGFTVAEIKEDATKKHGIQLDEVDLML